MTNERKALIDEMLNADVSTQFDSEPISEERKREIAVCQAPAVTVVQTFLGFDLTPLPNGKCLVTYSRMREGFTVPESVLLGTYDDVEQAKDFISEAQSY